MARLSLRPRVAVPFGPQCGPRDRWSSGVAVRHTRLADSAPIVRHRKLAAIGWSQTAERLVAYLERRTPWDS
jgi:hypothetical protein